MSFSYGPTPVLENVTFTCSAGERLCIIGPNGAGKSTLLRLATGRLDPESGSVTAVAAGAATPWNGEGTVADAVGVALKNDRTTIREFEAATEALATGTADPTSYDQLLTAMNARDLWSLDARIQHTLAGLELAHIPQERPVTSLSPGQQGRLRLALLLLASPDHLVLDEPTNHLDAHSRRFLIDTLLAFEGPVLFTSHDRDFIERTATALVDLDTAAWDALTLARGNGPAAGERPNGVHVTKGAYSDYLTAKAEARATHAAIHAQQQASKSSLRQHQRESEVVGHKDFAPRTETKIAQKFYADRAQAVSTRRKNDDAKRLEDLAKVEVRKPREENVTIALPAPEAQPVGVVFSARGLGAEGRLSPVDLEIHSGDHVLVTGANGAGKSTLLRLLAGEEIPGSYGATPPPPQHLAFVQQDLPGTAGEDAEEPWWAGGIGETGKGFLHPRFWVTPLRELSNGNKRRAQLAAAFAACPAVLLFDEPTNYLDVETIESLEAALKDWPGTVVMVSHDQWLIDRWPGKRLELTS